MGSATITNLLDTHVGQDQPLTNYNLGGSLYVRQWASSIRVAYLYFANPVPAGATITSAKLHLYGYAKPVAGTIQLYLRRLAQTIAYSKVTWNSRATAFSYPEVYASKSGTYPDQTEYEFDIAAALQPVADGAKWYGLQLGSDWVTETWSPRFMSVNHPNPDLRPWVEFTWSDAPDSPTQLAPAGTRVISTAKPILRFNYSDVSGDTDIAGAQVQVNTTSSFTSPAYDSGDQDVDSPQWDLTPSAFTAVAGTTYYWRVRVRDGAGLWSGWSAAASFVYRVLPVLEIQNPQPEPDNFVEEPTPGITWNVTSGTQVAYQLGLYRTVGSRDVLLWSRPRTVGTTDGFTVPAGVITVKDATYRIDVRVYDEYDREAVPNGPAYTQLTRYFTYEFSALTTPVSDLTAEPLDPYPGVTLEWNRATTPDSYSVIRDGLIIASQLDPDDDTWVSGTLNRWVDRFPVKNRVHTYSVQAIVNEKASASNPTVVAVNRLLGTWLVDATEGGPQVCLMTDKERTFVLEEDSAVYKVLGASIVSLVMQSLRAYSGNVPGELHTGVPGCSETADVWRSRLLELKANAGQLVYLFITGMTIPVVLQNVQVAPGVTTSGKHIASFDWHQQGLLPFTPKGLL